MLLNAHSYYSLRYGTLSVEQLVKLAKENGYEELVLTDINNATGAFEFVKICRQEGIKPITGMEFRDDETLRYIVIARNAEGFREINELQTLRNLEGLQLPESPAFENCYVIYLYGKAPSRLKENEFVGITPSLINKVRFDQKSDKSKYVILKTVVFENEKGFGTHQKLRAIHNNLLLTQVRDEQTCAQDDYFIPRKELLEMYAQLPELIENTTRILSTSSFDFNFSTVKNKKTFTGTHADDKLLLHKLAYEGLNFRYGATHKIAKERVEKELEIIDNLGFSAYFLITWDIVRYSMSRKFYHVGRGSGANSVVAYCLRITDVCPIELDLYFERFLNPKRKVPPDFDLDYSWKDRDDVINYVFQTYGRKHTALLGAMSTFKDRSIIREMGKVYGLPKTDIDRMIRSPNSPLNKNEICEEILSIYSSIEDYPNMRSIHAGGILISEEPITCYTALDLPPKGFPTAQFDMYLAEEINFEKLDVLSQRGIGHIKESAEIIQRNRGVEVDVFDFDRFKKDDKVRENLIAGDTIGCFYVESPAMRGLLKKLHCDNYLTLVAASSIIRPGVAKSGMMKAYIHRHNNRGDFKYLHPVMEEQLQETFGVMVYQEDVLKVGHHFGGLDLADADGLRRMMSGKTRNKKRLEEIAEKFFAHCTKMNYPQEVAKEVWRQIDSFAGYSFSKAHSASYAVESYQSLYLKSHYPLEFMVAVINNFGGFYNTRVYVNEAKKCGGTVHLPCVNNSTYSTTIYGTDIYLGFVHVKTLEQKIAQEIEKERERAGDFAGLEDFINRCNTQLEQLIILIRIDAFRFTGEDKRQLLWAAHLLFNERKRASSEEQLFTIRSKPFALPKTATTTFEDVYDEIELLEFPVTKSYFDLLKTAFRGECKVKGMLQHVGKEVRMMGAYVTHKSLQTSRGEQMGFGTFLDDEGEFFDTVHFPPSLKKYPFAGNGVYLILGKVVEEFGVPTFEVERMAKMPIHSDPRIG